MTLIPGGRKAGLLELVLDLVDASHGALYVMTQCYWPGNVRELENCIERTATMTRGSVISELNLPCQKNRCLTQTLHERTQPLQVIASGPMNEEGDSIIPFKTASSETRANAPPATERERLIWALEQCGWVQAKAARLFNVSARQMGYALVKYNIEFKKF